MTQNCFFFPCLNGVFQDVEISGLNCLSFFEGQEIFEFKSTLFFLNIFSPTEVIYSLHYFNYESDRIRCNMMSKTWK